MLMDFNLSAIRREIEKDRREKQYFEKLEQERRTFRLFYCQNPDCREKLYGHEKHHFLCNKCWEQQEKKNKIMMEATP